MTDDKDIRPDRPELDDEEREDPTLTRRISDASDSEAKTASAESASEPASASGGVFRQMWRRIREERNRPQRVGLNTRGQNNMDRSKAFLVLATAVVFVAFAFLVLFSTSGADQPPFRRRKRRRVKRA